MKVTIINLLACLFASFYAQSTYGLSQKWINYSQINQEEYQKNLNHSIKNFSPKNRNIPNANTFYSGEQYISTTFVSEYYGEVLDKYVLFDETRGDGIEVIDASQYEFLQPLDGINLGYYEFLSSDLNQWGYNNDIFSVNIKKQVALDVLWALQLNYDFYRMKFGIKSFDNKNGKIHAFINYGKNLAFAAWTSSPDNSIVLGEGGENAEGDDITNPWTSLDIVSHEYAHGILETFIGFKDEKESGAIKEGLCDILAVAIEDYSNESKNIWYFGDEIGDSSGMIRNHANPKSRLHPDTYHGEFWNDIDSCVPNSQSNDNCYIHNHSNIVAHWFYILTEGKSGTNDLGNTYDVIGIDFKKALHIVFSTIYNKTISPDGNFLAFREATVKAAKELYGSKSMEQYRVALAWYAVGVGEKPPFVVVFPSLPIKEFQIFNP